MKEIFNKIKNAVFYALFPNKCVFCDNIIGLQGNVCENCEKTLTYVKPGICSKCGKDDCICLSEKFAFDEVVVPFYYDKAVRASIQRFKFQNAHYYAETYAYFIAKRLLSSVLAGLAEVITYVPLARKDRRHRGYDQAECVAKELALITGIECVQLLRKVRNTKKQHDLGGKERRKNLKGAFEVTDGKAVEGKTIILCDDVMTTGSTLNETASALKKKGAKKVICCVVATTYCRNGIFMAEYN